MSCWYLRSRYPWSWSRWYPWSWSYWRCHQPHPMKICLRCIQTASTRHPSNHSAARRSPTKHPVVSVSSSSCYGFPRKPTDAARGRQRCERVTLIQRDHNQNHIYTVYTDRFFQNEQYSPPAIKSCLLMIIGSIRKPGYTTRQISSLWSRQQILNCTAESTTQITKTTVYTGGSLGCSKYLDEDDS